MEASQLIREIEAVTGKGSVAGLRRTGGRLFVKWNTLEGIMIQPAVDTVPEVQAVITVHDSTLPPDSRIAQVDAMDVSDADKGTLLVLLGIERPPECGTMPGTPEA